jgi:hypothetical protein
MLENNEMAPIQVGISCQRRRLKKILNWRDFCKTMKFHQIQDYLKHNLIQNPDAGTMIILMDSVRKRLISTSTRLAIASKLAPIQVGIFVSKKTTEKTLNWRDLENNEIPSNSKLF